MINSVTDYSHFPCKILRRELHSEVRNEGGKAQWLQSWIQWPQSNATFKFGCLWFAFLSVNLEHEKIDDCQKVILHNAVRWNFSLSINLRSVSVNKTHGTGLLLLSVNNHCAKKQHTIQGLKVNKHFLLLKYLWSAGGWGLAGLGCPISHIWQLTSYWLSWWNRLVMFLLSFFSSPTWYDRMNDPTPPSPNQRCPCPNAQNLWLCYLSW